MAVSISSPKQRSAASPFSPPKRFALDGRGNLTLSGLIAWVDYTLGTCIDQVEFMGRQMDVRGMRDRIAAALSFEESTVKSGVRKEPLAPLPHGEVRFAVPRHALRFYFPALWPEAEQDQALLQAELKVSETARADLTTAPKT